MYKLLLFLSLLLCTISNCFAQQWPSHQIRIIVPTTPGTGTDIIARQIADQLKQILHTSIIVENKPGASSTIGMRYVAHANPDGYTLLFNSSQGIIAPYVLTDSGYTDIDFVPIAPIVDSKILLVTPTNRYSTVEALINKGKTDLLLFGEPGYGTPTHIAGLKFARENHLNVQAIPYSGTPQVMTDLVAGRVDYAFLLNQTVEQYAKQNILSVFPHYNFDLWTGLFAPANTPSNIIIQLSQAIAQIKQSRQFIEKTSLWQTTIMKNMTPLQFSEFINEQSRYYSTLVTSLGLTKQ